MIINYINTDYKVPRNLLIIGNNLFKTSNHTIQNDAKIPIQKQNHINTDWKAADIKSVKFFIN